jgi:alpha-1,6-mannosyltransferase
VTTAAGSLGPRAGASTGRARLRASAGLFLVAAGLGAFAFVPPGRAEIGRTMALYALAVAGFVLVWTAPRAVGLRAVLVVAVLVRLALLPGAPALSDDVYRYVWDGRVQLAGFNPYEHAPDSPALDAVDYDDRGLVGLPYLRTIYPPLAELLFLVVAIPGGGVVAFKLVFGFFDALTAYALWRTVAPSRRHEVLTLYVLSPLVVLEVWHGVHLEVVTLPLIVVAAALVERRRDAWAGAALGAAAALKLSPAFLVVPALVGRRARARRFLPAFAAAFALPYLPYVLAGGGLVGSAADTGARPEGNAFVFSVLHGPLGYSTTRAAVIVLFVAGSLAIALRTRGRERSTAAFAWTATLLVLVLPVVHPWYWLAPLTLAIAAGLRLPVALGLAAPASDLGFAAWWPSWWRVSWLTYVPLVGAGIWWAWRRRATGDRRGTRA